MKTMKKLTPILIALLAIVVSCNNDEPEPEPEPIDYYEKIEVSWKGPKYQIEIFETTVVYHLVFKKDSVVSLVPQYGDPTLDGFGRRGLFSIGESNLQFRFQDESPVVRETTYLYINDSTLVITGFNAVGEGETYLRYHKP